MRTLRKDKNHFTCMPDDPTTPGQGPMCADPNAWDFILALMAHKDPPKGKIGFACMMRGGRQMASARAVTLLSTWLIALRNLIHLIRRRSSARWMMRSGASR